MFDDALYARLAANGDLCALLNTFNDRPAIFSDVAHKDATRPYVVFMIDREESDEKAVDSFTVDIDYYEYTDSRKNARDVVEAIEYDLDMAQLTSDRYQNIRFFKPSSTPVIESEIKAVHYNIRFFVRATRKKWIDQL